MSGGLRTYSIVPIYEAMNLDLRYVSRIHAHGCFRTQGGPLIRGLVTTLSFLLLVGTGAPAATALDDPPAKAETARADLPHA